MLVARSGLAHVAALSWHAARRGYVMQNQTSDLREVIVQGSVAGLAQEIRVGPHRLVTDEPTAAGGGDTGPTPYDLLLAALGS
jgi:hypothetical protein